MGKVLVIGRRLWQRLRTRQGAMLLGSLVATVIFTAWLIGFGIALIPTMVVGDERPGGKYLRERCEAVSVAADGVACGSRTYVGSAEYWTLEVIADGQSETVSLSVYVDESGQVVGVQQ